MVKQQQRLEQETIYLANDPRPYCPMKRFKNDIGEDGDTYDYATTTTLGCFLFHSLICHPYPPSFDFLYL